MASQACFTKAAQKARPSIRERPRPLRNRQTCPLTTSFHKTRGTAAVRLTETFPRTNSPPFESTFRNQSDQTLPPSLHPPLLRGSFEKASVRPADLAILNESSLTPLQDSRLLREPDKSIAPTQHNAQMRDSSLDQTPVEADFQNYFNG